MDRQSIDRIREATFPVARKGYEVEEVDRYLGELADWLEAESTGRPAGSESLKRELELMGEKAASILSQAEESAERLKAEALQEASNALARARQEAEAARGEAEEYAAQVRREADEEAAATRGSASAEVQAATQRAEADARRSVEERQSRRDELEAEVRDLEVRRDDALADLARLADDLRDMVSPTPAPAAMPAVPQPAPEGNGTPADSGREALTETG